MRKRIFLSAAAVFAGAVLFFCACSSKTEEGPSGKDGVPSVETTYVDDMLDNLLLLKMFLENYQVNSGAYPENLKPLNYPGLQLFSTGGKKDTVIGSLPEKYLRVRYEPTSFGNARYPLIYITYTPDNKLASGDKFAALQYSNGEITCVANVEEPNANSACMRFKGEADKSNPIKNYYSLKDYMSGKNMEPLEWKLQELLQQAAKGAPKERKIKSGVKVASAVKVK